MPKPVLPVIALAFGLSGAAIAAPQGRPAPAPAAPYRHAYYLFLAEAPNGCEACYVPLLLSAAPLEEIAKDSAGQDCDLITTYERDSIFQLNGIVRIEPRDVQAPPRMIRVRERSYRYQEIAGAEVLRLLEHPVGAIPISRPFLHSDLPPGPSVEALIAAFRAP